MVLEQIRPLPAAVDGHSSPAQAVGLHHLASAARSLPQPLTGRQGDVGDRDGRHAVLLEGRVGCVPAAGDLLDVQHIHVPIAVDVRPEAAFLHLVEGEEVVGVVRVAGRAAALLDPLVAGAVQERRHVVGGAAADLSQLVVGLPGVDPSDNNQQRAKQSAYASRPEDVR